MKAFILAVVFILIAAMAAAYTDKVYFTTKDGFGPKGDWTYGSSSDATAAKNAVVVWERGCASGKENAYFTMDSGKSYARRIELRHLETSADDSFQLFVKEGTTWKLIGTHKNKYSDTRWITTGFNLPNERYKGVLNFRVKATGAKSSACSTRGQVAMYYAKIYLVPTITTTLSIRENVDDPLIGIGPTVMLLDATMPGDATGEQHSYAEFGMNQFNPGYWNHANGMCQDPYDWTNMNFKATLGVWYDLKIEANLYNGVTKFWARPSGTGSYNYYGRFQTDACSTLWYNRFQYVQGLQRSNGAESDIDDVVVKYTKGSERTVFTERFEDSGWASDWSILGGTLTLVPHSSGYGSKALRVSDTTVTAYTGMYRDFVVPKG